VSGNDRADRIKRQKRMGVLRGIHEAELEAAGAARTAAVTHAEEELDRIARLLPDAVNAGIGMTEIARLTGVSRPTLYELRGRYSDEPRDLRIAVLQALMSYETSFQSELVDYLGRTAEEIKQIIDDFASRGWIEWDFEGQRPAGVLDRETGEWIETDGPKETPWSITRAGDEALEDWQFEDDGQLSAGTDEP